MVYLFLADGFEEMEAIVPLDILRRADVAVQTVGIAGKETTGAHGITLLSDMTIDAGDFSDAEAVILPGGMPGTTNLKACKRLTDIVMDVAQAGKYVAAICAAPSIPGSLGLLKGKKATCFPGFEDQLCGATVSRQSVVVDGTIVTAKGAGCAAEFGFALVELLKGGETASKLRAAMQF